ncbi:hypothetical protein [Hymenobacter sp. PAMC 26628]|uniref:hypothetical protein n=1 Tax=Hymenobacter sp. PAMC 26628 TaxID=1484118 RepID=UPI00076FFF4B|nr:hypothetical protein [Hymenobacter sp. PAMC 26628]AMJ64291.1 hypothetical protein AXW84_01725 [Hymenobacter sp. PAMC 26628]
MKTILTLLTGLALGALLLPARAQTAPAKPLRSATPAAPRPKVVGAAVREPGGYKGPYVVSDTKELGQKFIQHSRPDVNQMHQSLVSRPHE